MYKVGKVFPCSFFHLLIHLHTQISLINFVKTLLFCVTYIEFFLIIRFGQVNISIQAVFKGIVSQMIEIFYQSTEHHCILDHFRLESNELFTHHSQVHKGSKVDFCGKVWSHWAMK